MTKLYVTKSAFAAFLILTIGTSSDAYPLLPRHLSLAATLTIGIPTFFLALAPSSGPWRPSSVRARRRALRCPGGRDDRGRVVAGYLFALHDLDLSVADARTVALTTLVACGLYLVLALEAGGSRKRSTLVAGMCAVMGGLYVLSTGAPRHKDLLRVDRALARHDRNRDPRRLRVDRRPRAVRLLAAIRFRAAADDVSRTDEHRPLRVRDHRRGDAAE